jgi:hypothetical protein
MLSNNSARQSEVHPANAMILWWPTCMIPSVDAEDRKRMIALLLAYRESDSARGPAVESQEILEARMDCFMKRLFIGAVMIGGIAGQLAAD